MQKKKEKKTWEESVITVIKVVGVGLRVHRVSLSKIRETCTWVLGWVKKKEWNDRGGWNWITMSMGFSVWTKTPPWDWDIMIWKWWKWRNGICLCQRWPWIGALSMSVFQSPSASTTDLPALHCTNRLINTKCQQLFYDPGLTRFFPSLVFLGNERSGLNCLSPSKFRRVWLHRFCKF